MKATYYNDNLIPHVLNAKENKDGTVDLSDEAGNVLVTNCPLSDEPKVGHAVLIKDKKPAEEKKAK